MKARILALAAILVLVAASTASAGEAPKTIRWKVQSCFPLNMPLTDNAVALWAKKVQEMTGGRMTIELHGDGAIVKGPAIYEAVRDGGLDAGQNTPAWQKGRFPAGDLFYTLPGGVTEYHDYILWVYGGGGWQLAQEMYKGEVVVFPLGLTPPEEIWTNKPSKSLADFKGLKMRNAGLSMELFQKLGASVVLLAGGEVVPSLQRGVIDAAEFSDASMDLALGLPDVAKYVIGPPIHMGSNMFQLLVNPKSYEALPADLKAIVREATISATLEGYARHWSEAIKAFEKIKQKGVTVIKLSAKDQAEARKLTYEILEEKSKKDAFFKKVWESQRDFKKGYQPYHNFTAFDQ